jgi:flagellar motor switch protein FliN/FliY
VTGLIEDARPQALGDSAGDDKSRNEDAWGARGREAVMRIPVSVRIVLGAAKMPVSKLMSLNRGSIIPLDRKVGDLVDIVVNDRVVARGEVIVIDEEASRFAVSVREVVTPSD